MTQIRQKIILLMIIHLSYSLSLKGHQQSVSDFCWRDSQPRGVGTIPTECPNGRVKIGLLCYSPCPAGFYRFGFDCHQNCPRANGWADQGLFCRLSQYGRGAGYPWKFGDYFNDSGMKSRCQADNGKDNCQKYGLMYYPKCNPGFYAFGCCICRPRAPNCAALGFNGGVDLSCAKKVIIGDPISMDCANGLQYDAGLCYKPCPKDFNGVGPVCWKIIPTGWVNCGMGAAKDSKICSSVIFDQVSSVGNLALSIATLGAGKAAKLAKDASKAAQLRKKFQQLKKLQSSNQRAKNLVSAAQGRFPPTQAGKGVSEIMASNSNTVPLEDIVRVSSQIASLADPTGATDVAGAYTYPKCSKIKV